MTRRAPEKATSSSSRKPSGAASKPTPASKPTTRGASKGAPVGLAKSAAGARRAPSAAPAPEDVAAGGAHAPDPRSRASWLGALRALAFALDKKALDPVLLDVRDVVLVLQLPARPVGPQSDRQVDAITDAA
jgi:hypothetical protein